MSDLPLVLVETGDPEGLPDPVVTKDARVTLVSIPWDRPLDPFLRAEAIRALSEYEGEHPRIDLALKRLRVLAQGGSAT